MSVDFALFILRVLVGLLLAGHGAQKVFGWFGGYGLKGTSGWLGSLGLQPAWFWGLLAAFGEFGGGLSLALGFLTPLGALAIIGAMSMAIAVAHWSKGLWNTNGGYEFPLTLLVTSLVIGLTGPGRYSLDGLLNLSLPTWFFWAGLVGVVVINGYGLALIKQQTSRAAIAQEQPAA